jgi:predicted GH43/DUF377 family glycosyl hydrolase
MRSFECFVVIVFCELVSFAVVVTQQVRSFERCEVIQIERNHGQSALSFALLVTSRLATGHRNHTNQMGK